MLIKCESDWFQYLVTHYACENNRFVISLSELPPLEKMYLFKFILKMVTLLDVGVDINPKNTHNQIELDFHEEMDNEAFLGYLSKPYLEISDLLRECLT